LLFFDKILSGNQDIACATCHHPKHASTDAVSLGLGTGASGLGPERAAGPDQPVFGRVPRNSPALFNRGALAFSTLFHDGRVERDPDGAWSSGFWTPARDQLPPGLDSPLAAQAMFPVLSSVEMAGHKGENEIADAAAADRLAGPDGAWDRLAARLRAYPEYVSLFRAAYPDVRTPDEVTYVLAANAIAAFEATAFRADRSPFDAFLNTGDAGVLDEPARRGMDLFYGEAGCANCHAGPFQSDQGFHAVAMPQIGPGKGDGANDSYWRATGFPARLEDYGRYRVTFDAADLYKFRTPSLRNVELTGPWGHDGAYASLEAVVRHMLAPAASLESYDVDQAILPKPQAVISASGSGAALRFDPVNPARLADYRKRDGWVQGNPELRAAIAGANELPSVALDDAEVADLVAFLGALTDPTSRDLEHLVPAAVPSGLPVAD
jgi:cytochrome c peroxidase